MRSASHDRPERTFWIEPGRVLGGEYPGDRKAAVARAKLEALLDLGIRAFASLMEPDETSPYGAFVPYVPVVEALARERGIEVEFARFPIRDVDIPTADTMRAILAWLDDRVAAKRPCYVHCWGGRGRTGTVAGVHLIRRGAATPENFVEVIATLRPDDLRRGSAPQTEARCDFVRSFARATG